MSLFRSLLQTAKRQNLLSDSMRLLSLGNASVNRFPSPSLLRCPQVPAAQFHTTGRCSNLMEFFDDPENWGKKTVRCGRSWTTEELRLKSNSDLHKLWYVLLKEKNMLITMEFDCNEQYEYFPNPERFDKVEISMENIEAVVRERNRAYHQLETGRDGERPGKVVYNALGLTYFYRKEEHFVPKHLNTRWNRKFGYDEKEVREFKRQYAEKKFNTQRWERRQKQREIRKIMRLFPHVKMETLQKKYPELTKTIQKYIDEDVVRGHYQPKIWK